jgi:hypothetical protein
MTGRRFTTISTAVLFAAVLVCAAGRPAAAGEAQPAADAETLMRQGIELRRAGKDAEALGVFQRAYALDGAPRALAQVGLAEQALGKWGLADQHLRQALASSADTWVRKNRAVLEDALKVIGHHVGVVEVSGSPAGAEVRIDGELVGRLPLPGPVSVTAGGIAIEVRAPGFLTIARAATVDVGELTRESFNLQSLTPTTRASAEPQAPPPAAAGATEPAAQVTAPAPPPGGQDQMGARRVVTLSIAGLAVGALALGVIEHLSWQSKVGSFDDMAGCDPAAPSRGGSACQQLYDDGQRAKTIAFVGYGLSAGLAATAAILYFTQPAREPPKMACASGPAAGSGAVMTCAWRF